MEKLMKIILKEFDIRKAKKSCNLIDCKCRPSHEMILYQRTMRKGRKNLASIYVCKKHIKDVQRVSETIGKLCPSALTECQVIEVKGTVAQPGRAHG